MTSYVITGAARGIGFEFVNQLSATSTNVVFALVRDIKTAQKLIDLKRKNVHVLEADITNIDALNASLPTAATKVKEITGGSLDYLINNAALVGDEYSHLTLDGYPDSATLEKTLVDYFKINVVCVINTINIFLPLLKFDPKSAKKVIVISSGVADEKFSLLTENAFATQYKKEGFTFLSLSPGWVDTSVGPPTPKDKAIFQALLAAFQKVDPTLTRQLTPEESVKAQLEVIYRWKVEDSGAFVSHHGDKNWL